MWDKLALILLVIGGINWGLVGIFELDLVAWIHAFDSSFLIGEKHQMNGTIYIGRQITSWSFAKSFVYTRYFHKIRDEYFSKK